MSFFFKGRVRTSELELVKAIKESLLVLNSKTVVEDRAIGKALEDVEKYTPSMRRMLSGDGESEPNPEMISQIAIEICKEDVLSHFIHNLPTLGWEVRKDFIHCWSILLRESCCVDYIEKNPELLDFLLVCYNDKDIALHCGIVLRECIKYPNLTRHILESESFQLFFKYVELPNFDIASDALATFKDLLTKHETEVSRFLTNHYVQFFACYKVLLSSVNYVTRRQSLKLLLDVLLESPNSHVMKRFILEPEYLNIMMALLKDSSKNIQISAFHIFKVFVANPNKSMEIIEILSKNQQKLLLLLYNLPPSKGEDDQFEEEKDLIIQEIEALGSLPGNNETLK